MQEAHQHLPDTNRLSILAASILLAYALLPFIQIPERNLSIQISGISFDFPFSFSTIIAILTASLAAAGTDMLLHDHPRLGRQRTFQHWLIPAMTAWVIGVPLTSLEVGMQWWAVFAFGGLLFVLVLVSEYIVVDPYDTRYGPASVGLTAVSYALFLILTITLAESGTRLYVLIPGLTLAIFLITLRNLYLRLGSRWCVSWALGIALVIGQVTTALHYLPIPSLRFGLVILGLAYALSSVAGSIEEGRPWSTLWIEPAVMLVVLLGLAWSLGG